MVVIDSEMNKCGVEHSPLFETEGTQSHIVTWGSQTPQSNMEHSPGFVKEGSQTLIVCII